MATKYLNAVVRVLNTYQFGSKSLVVALDALIGTAMENTKGENRDEIAESTCLGTLHPTAPASGLICRKCFDAVESGNLPPDEDGGILPKEEEDEIAKQVRAMIGAPEDEGV